MAAMRNDPEHPRDGMTFCTHEAFKKRPLRLRGYESPQMVCASCWNYALRNSLVDR